MALFAVLAAAAIAVFTLLPDWVAARQEAARNAGPVPDPVLAVPSWTRPPHDDPSSPPTASEAEPPETQAAGGLARAEPPRARVPERSPQRTVWAPRSAETPQPAARPGDDAFRQAMSDGLTALERSDYSAAREAFSRAEELRPGSPQSADGMARVEVGLRLVTVTGLFAEAEALEAAEDWRAAAQRYGQVLGLDPAVERAQVGLARSRERAELSERLGFHVANPRRLSYDEVLREAATILAEAAEIELAGPLLRRQVADLGALLEAFSTPVRAVLASDGLTEVTVHRVGRLGTFDRRALDLRPGTYTVVGSRPGYRDVRRPLVIEPGTEPAPLLIRCEEEI